MSQPGPHPPSPTLADDPAANATAARSVVRHHAQLAAGLDQRVEALLRLVDGEYLIRAATARQDLLGYVRREILPHALAEESVLYPPAAALAEGRLLVGGMLGEHRALTALVDELADATSLVRAAAAGRALGALFATHLAKENDLVLPMLVAAPQVSLSDVLAGMHELLGAYDAAPTVAAEAGSPTDGCGGENCGCGGDQPANSAEAPLLSVDTRLDRELPHSQRHALVVSTVAALPLWPTRWCWSPRMRLVRSSRSSPTASVPRSARSGCSQDPRSGRCAWNGWPHPSDRPGRYVQPPTGANDKHVKGRTSRAVPLGAARHARGAPHMCEYCGCQAVTAIDDLTREHDLVALQRPGPQTPRPVLAEIDDREIRTRWLQSGQEAWQVRLKFVAGAA